MRNMLLLLAFGLAGCSGEEAQQAQGVTSTAVIVGTHQDLSGPLVSWGAPVRNGLMMAADDINAAGGIQGREIRLLVEDNGYDPQKAVLAVRKLVSRDRVFAILAPLGSPTSLASMPLALDKGVLHLFPFAAAEGTYEPHHALKFASNVPYKDSIRVGVRHFVENLSRARAGILYQDDDFGLDVRRGVEEELARYGLEPVSITTYKRGATDFSAQIARMRAAGADFVVMGTVIRETIGAIRAARSLGWDVPFLCSQACYTPEVHDLGKEVVEGLIATGQFPIPYHDDPAPEIRDWLERYEARFNLKPNVQAISAYTIMNLFAAGLDATGANPTPEAYAKALEGLPAWTDPLLGGPPIDYTAEDHLGVNQAFLAQITNGRWKTISDNILVHAEE